MMRNYRPPIMSHSIHQRIIALVLLVAYAITGTSVMPAVVSLAAWVDGSHAVIVQQSEQGLQVTLHHRSNEYTPRVSDHCNALAKVIVSMCAASEEGDHQMSTAHVTANASLRAEAGQKVQTSQARNVQETHLLTLSVLRPAREMIRACFVQDTHEQKRQRRPMLTCVRLLI